MADSFLNKVVISYNIVNCVVFASGKQIVYFDW